MTPSCLPTSMKAATARSICSSVCAALSCVRIRAWGESAKGRGGGSGCQLRPDRRLCSTSRGHAGYASWMGGSTARSSADGGPRW
eukprot:scaffold25695_cov145-Isochrysis_galbana.AAC.2